MPGVCCDSWPVEGVIKCRTMLPGVAFCSPRSRVLPAFINSELADSEFPSCSCVSGDVKVSELPVARMGRGAEDYLKPIWIIVRLSKLIHN